MFKWIKNFLEKLLNKNKKMIKAPITVSTTQGAKNSEKENRFLQDLKRHANSEACDGNGYNIIPKIRLKDML